MLTNYFFHRPKHDALGKTGRLPRLAAFAGSVCAAAALTAVFGSPCRSAGRPDIIVSDFEGASYDPGWVATGGAFGAGPARGTLDRQNQVLGFHGKSLVNSYYGTDASTGELSSPPFTIERSYIRFLIGGGDKPGAECVNLVIDGQIARTATGDDSENLESAQWDVSKFIGKQAIIRIVDHSTDGWGHILVDDILQTDQSLPASLTDPVAKAIRAVKAAIPAAISDPKYAAFHFHAPAQWMNDPNGPLYYNGWWHIFYQFNPYASSWGHMHWGHARSKDLVHWQHLPVALWPSKDRGEEHVFSGSVHLNASGIPTAFYTSIAPLSAPRDPEQWAAVPVDKDLIRWRKLDSEPVVSEKNSGAIHINEWRDPFIVSDRGSVYMLTGGGLNGKGVVCEYKALNGDLTDWKYIGSLFTDPDSDIGNIECPNLVKIGDRWALLISVHGRVEYFTGEADLANCRFSVMKRGVIDDGSYASQAAYGPNGECVLFAWIGSVSGNSWTGCMALPRILRISDDWTLESKPVEAIHALRQSRQAVNNIPLDSPFEQNGERFAGKMELNVDIDPGSASGITIDLPLSGEKNSLVALHYDVKSQTLSSPGWRSMIVPPDPSPGGLKLDIFVDKALIEVFGDNGSVSASGGAKSDENAPAAVRISADGAGARIRSLDLYELAPAPADLTNFHE